jgi:hypothetical protein
MTQSSQGGGVSGKVAETMRRVKRKTVKEKGARTPARLRAEVEPLAESDNPVLVGPFTGEVGFELLYWIPVIRWLVRELPSLAGRLVIVSRGGVRHWWETAVPIEDYADILSMFEPGDYVRRKGPDKQRRGVSEFDRNIVDQVRERLGLGAVDLLHPSVLFNFYYAVRRRSQFAFVEAVERTETGAEGLAAVYERIPPPEVNGALHEVLPEKYVAVRFYSRDSFPDTPENRDFARSVVDRLSGSRSVVLLDNSLQLDEHGDLAAKADGVITIDHLMRADNNLAVQTAVLARADAYVGTYGGLSYLAPFLGTPSVGFSTLPDRAHAWHLALAKRLFAGDGWGELITLAPKGASLLGLLDG